METLEDIRERMFADEISSSYMFYTENKKDKYIEEVMQANSLIDNK